MDIITEYFYYHLGLYETYLIMHTEEILKNFYDVGYDNYNYEIQKLIRLVNE